MSLLLEKKITILNCENRLHNREIKKKKKSNILIMLPGIPEITNSACVIEKFVKLFFL